MLVEFVADQKRLNGQMGMIGVLHKWGETLTSFAICGDAEVFEEASLGEIAVSVDIFNHEGNDPRVGDLTSEFLNSIDGATSNLEILVSGLEDCDSPEAGGFCTSSR